MLNLLTVIVTDYGDAVFVLGVLIYAAWADHKQATTTLRLALGALILSSTACTIDEMFPDPPAGQPGYYGAPPTGWDPYAPPPGPVTQPWMGPDGRMSLCTTVPSNPPTTFCYGQGTPRGLQPNGY